MGNDGDCDGDIDEDIRDDAADGAEDGDGDDAELRFMHKHTTSHALSALVPEYNLGMHM